MKLTIYGTGYVGLVTGACLAEVGHDVMCVDIDANKIAMLQAGEIPIYEPGLAPLVANNLKAQRLTFTTDAIAGVAHGVIQMIAVGTPPDEDGAADLSHVLAVATTIGEHLQDYHVIVTKSTVPVGTADKVDEALRAALDKRGQNATFDVASNPEFLKEGAAIGDFNRPDRIVVGTNSERAEKLMRELYAPINRNHDRLITMDVRSSELTKYAANAMLATKISFMNELANIAEKVGADIENIRVGIGSDSRIGRHFIYAGCGYGGSCFPKDVKALARTADEYGYEAELINSVESVNERQKSVLLEKILNHFSDGLQGLRFAVWGLAFKPETDDMREAPSRVMMEQLWARGATIAAFDPVASEEVLRLYGKRADLEVFDDEHAALEGVDGLIVMTEWKQFRAVDLERVCGLLRQPVVFDGRNIYDPEKAAKAGLIYYGVGRGSVPR